MTFMGKYEVVAVSKSELNSLGLPRMHRCMRCGLNHRIVWENIRFMDGVINFGKTRCGCGDEVTSIWGASESLAMQFSEMYRRESRR